MKRKIAVLGAVLAASLAMTTSAYADVVFTTGNHPQTNEEEVLLHGTDTINQGLTVTGKTNQSQTFVAFTSSETLVTFGGGQARVDALDGAFTDLSVSLLNGGTFGDIIFNLNTPNDQPGIAQITVHTTTGTVNPYNFNVSNGENFLTIVADSATRIMSVDINSNVGVQILNIDDARQFRISDIQGPTTPVPEPMPLYITRLHS